MTRSLTALFVLVGSLLLPGLASAADIPAPARPNVLFIMIDDLNDWVGFMQGHPQTRTPNMDRLAKRGVVFANANCAAPLCAPSRAAIYSGREPYRSGVYGNDDDLRKIAPNLILLPQHLKNNGYRTYGAGKLLHEKRADLFDESFMPEQRWSPFDPKQVSYTAEELPSKATDNPRHVVEYQPGKSTVLPLNRMPSDRRPKDPAAESFDWGPVDVDDEAMGDAQIATWAVQRLAAPATQPFFLGVGFYRPHIPLFAPRRYFEPFPVLSMTLPPTHADDLADLPEAARQIALDAITAGSHASVVKHGQWQAAVAAYLACVHFVDAQVGRLLDALDAGPHAANTIIILLGDHGWHLGEKQHWGKWTGWERSARVPLVVVPPATRRAEFASNTTTQQPVSLIDLYPTINEFVGLSAPATGLDGRALQAVMRSPATSTGRAVVTTFHGHHFSVRDERWRYIRYQDGSEELYDHATDPNEWQNLAGRPESTPIKARLGREIPAKPVPPRS